MRISLTKLKFKEDFFKVKVLHRLHFSFLLLAIILKAVILGQIFLGPLKLLIAFIYFKIHFRTVRELYYSFWPFTAILVTYLSIVIVLSLRLPYGHYMAVLYGLSLIFLLCESYIVSSPIYFPRVSWWVYDFRFRCDVKIMVQHDGKEFEGRLMDLRRGAGCIVMFDYFPGGTTIKVRTEEGPDQQNLSAMMVSRREQSIGRGYIYGVKFLFSTADEKKQFKLFSRLWNSERLFKKKLFHAVNTSYES